MPLQRRKNKQQRRNKEIQERAPAAQAGRVRVGLRPPAPRRPAHREHPVVKSSLNQGLGVEASQHMHLNLGDLRDRLEGCRCIRIARICSERGTHHIQAFWILLGLRPASRERFEFPAESPFLRRISVAFSGISSRESNRSESMKWRLPGNFRCAPGWLPVGPHFPAQDQDPTTSRGLRSLRHHAIRANTTSDAQPAGSILMEL